MVVFTGGEATLSKDLLDGINRATAHGLATRLVTNGWWAKTSRLLENMIANLKRVGLKELNLSTGDEHIRFVPVEYVAKCAYAAVEAGFYTAIMIEQRSKRAVTESTFRALPIICELFERFTSARFKIVESPWMPLDDRLIADYELGSVSNRSNVLSRGGCDSILKTTTVQANGNIAACCGIGMRLIPELQLGRLGDITLADADKVGEEDFLKRWIRVEGPEAILAWAQQFDSSIQWENMYAHRCQACIRLYKDPNVRKVITEHYEAKVCDVLFAEWLLYEYQPEADDGRESGEVTPS